jgi:hypothetical protein
MALNTPNTSAKAVPDGEYLNLVVRGIEELNKETDMPLTLEDLSLLSALH